MLNANYCYDELKKGLCTTRCKGPFPWTSYAILIGPPRPLATFTSPFADGFKSQVTVLNSGWLTISAAVSGALGIKLIHGSMSQHKINSRVVHNPPQNMYCDDLWGSNGICTHAYIR